MKISELTRINEVRRDAEVPLAVEGENFNITMGQIMDALSKGVVHFKAVRPRPEYMQFAQSAPQGTVGEVVFDTQSDNFYLAVSSDSEVAGQTVTTWVYFSQWGEYDDFYDGDGIIRRNCVFCAEDGRLYVFDGESLKSAGLTEEQAKQIRHATPIEVASEEEMQQRIALGEYEEGQLYFLAES